MLLLIDWACFAALISATVLLSAWWAKLICGLAAGIVIGRLFIIGHDACHQSYTPHRRLYKVLGRIAMAPSLTPYSLMHYQGALSCNTFLALVHRDCTTVQIVRF